MKVLIIDPRGYKTPIYPNGLCSGLAPNCDLTLATSYYYNNTSGAQYKINRVFFKFTDKMRKSKMRKIIRALEYIKGYFKILNDVKKQKYDVVHFQWCLLTPIDCYFIKKIKRYTKKLVFTAHNVLPHVDGERQKEGYEKLYSLMDTVLVHGENIRAEFKEYFPQMADKVRIQFHGTYLGKTKEYDISKIDKSFVEKIKAAKKVYIFFGYIFRNKGTDLLIDIWKREFKDSESLLIIAGSVRERYKEYSEAVNGIENLNNLLLIEGYISENLLNYFLNYADMVMLPYRHASMSGVIFTAAEMSKTVLCTNTGSIPEYLENNTDSFMCDIDKYAKEWISIDSDCSKEALHRMGMSLRKNIQRKYDWSEIAKNLMEVYKTDTNA